MSQKIISRKKKSNDIDIIIIIIVIVGMLVIGFLLGYLSGLNKAYVRTIGCTNVMLELEAKGYTGLRFPSANYHEYMKYCDWLGDIRMKEEGKGG
jgi:NhaP-type Na+/H+ or K+/H+ antiporter